ncbi:hypothetical protein TcYC6_0019380 [Trypanosoma cruzi]|uniref:Uncharacterized protein n=1 Tax=Trypanosoma cruzi TaxID=5693 RepID=A0A7J6XNH7_TRYCR|nr:hypothetical protein ECC02_011493 [Trypanosoma cruzi]KAF8279256.1 hypothetical protein TcYC6_0019380 [Trypanosoma cruzi]
MEKAKSAAEVAYKAHIASPGKMLHFTEFIRKVGIKSSLTPWLCCAVGSSRGKLGASSRPGWRYLRGMAAPHPHPLESVVLRTELGRVCALPRQQANLLVYHFVRVLRATLPYAAAAARRTSLVPGGWEMDRPLTPYELDVTIRDSLLGSAPGHDNMLNEFLHRLGPVARGTLRNMIHSFFANGSLPEDSMSGSDDGDSSSPFQADISRLPLSFMVKKSDGEDSLGP